jgi:hypothetical protein
MFIAQWLVLFNQERVLNKVLVELWLFTVMSHLDLNWSRGPIPQRIHRAILFECFGRNFKPGNNDDVPCQRRIRYDRLLPAERTRSRRHRRLSVYSLDLPNLEQPSLLSTKDTVPDFTSEVFDHKNFHVRDNRGYTCLSKALERHTYPLAPRMSRISFSMIKNSTYVAKVWGIPTAKQREDYEHKRWSFQTRLSFSHVSHQTKVTSRLKPRISFRHSRLEF